jgi:dolichol-phosphate mannosyltransferase
MRPARRTSVRRPLLAGVCMLGLLFLLFGRGGSATYDPAAAARLRTGVPDSGGIAASIVVPAYHERENVRPLVTQVFAALRAPRAAEIVIVDDNSRDGTVEECAALRAEGYNVVLITRTDAKGLSSAVIRGFEEARGQALVVMDADLQHPPVAVQALLDALADPATPIALGTRYGPGVAMDANWPLYRRVISWGARSLARPLTSASDPMTGFFGIRKELVRAARCLCSQWLTLSCTPVPQVRPA